MAADRRGEYAYRVLSWFTDRLGGRSADTRSDTRTVSFGASRRVLLGSRPAQAHGPRAGQPRTPSGTSQRASRRTVATRGPALFLYSRAANDRCHRSIATQKLLHVYHGGARSVLLFAASARPYLVSFPRPGIAYLEGYSFYHYDAPSAFSGLRNRVPAGGRHEGFSAENKYLV